MSRSKYIYLVKKEEYYAGVTTSDIFGLFTVRREALTKMCKYEKKITDLGFRLFRYVDGDSKGYEYTEKELNELLAEEYRYLQDRSLKYGERFNFKKLWSVGQAS